MAVLNIIVHLMPSFLVLTLPIACLIASISAFGRLTADKELVAMQSAGVSLFRLSVPVIVFSTLVFGLTLTLSEWGQPWSNLSLKKLALSLVKDQLTLALDTGVFNEPIPGLTIYIPEHQRGTTPSGVFIADQRQPSAPRIITADTFQMLQDVENTQLGIRLFDGIIHQAPADPAHYHQVAFSTYDLKMDLMHTISPSIRPRPSYQEILTRLQQSQWQDSTALRRLMEYYKDLAFPTSAFLFGLLGLPLGAVTHRGGRVGSFTVGIGMVILYYLLNVVGEFFVTALILHPFAGAWFPNILILLITIGLFSYLRLRRP